GSYVPGKPSRNEKPVTVTPSGAPASPASALDRNRRRAHRRGRRGERETGTETPRDDHRNGGDLGSAGLAGIRAGSEQKKSAPQRTQRRNERSRESIPRDRDALGSAGVLAGIRPKREEETGTDRKST